MSRRIPQSEPPPSATSHGVDGTRESERIASHQPPTWLVFLVSTLVVARYFLPTESTALGETLWIVQFWLIAAAIWFWLRARSGQGLRRLDVLDLGLGLLVGGHVLSAIVILTTEGDRRAALNMLWEWLGIGVSALLIRETVSEPFGRNRLLSVLLISAITLSGLGIWQHHVWYPRMSGMLTEFEELAQRPATRLAEAADRERRLDELRGDLGLLTAENNSSAAQLLRARIIASQEPIGRFALANTLAGLLLVGLFLGAGLLLEKAREAIDWRWWLGFVLMLALGYCFWLTKSRTAWAGLLVGLLIWGVLSWRRRRVGAGLISIGGLFALALVALPVAASLTGGLDREVILEAPKSLQYRLEYWSATGGVIRDHSWIGVGPGNFRQAYLQYKLPGSSEEVLDPHNLFLDVWANGGLIALAGLLTILLAMCQALSQSRQPHEQVTSSVEPDRFPSASVWRVLVGALALGITAFAELFNGVGFSTHSWSLLWGWCAVSFLWPTAGWSGNAGPLFVATVAALIVHLMGAGGMAMPAILQTFVILAACAMRASQAPQQTETTHFVTVRTVPWRAVVGAITCLTLSVACALTGTLPVSEARTQTQVGRALMTQVGGFGRGMSAFRAAIDADSLAFEPWQELALAMMADWDYGDGTDDETFRSAVSAQQQAIGRNPHSAHLWQILGRMWWRHYEIKRERSAAEQAVEAFRQAVVLYPNLATLQVEYAQAAAAAGQLPAAQNAAAYALKLDELNRKHGHVDKYLPDAARKRAESIVGQGL